jgi:glycosyltransferase involved in cell wall biosynthesis
VKTRGEKSHQGWRASWRRRLPSRFRAIPRSTEGAPHVLIIVQNLPVPLDRRVWLECQSLRSRGYEVSVICPKGPGDPAHQVIDGVEIFKYRPAPEANGLVGYALEFTYSWLRTAVLARKLWHGHPFHVVQACNPPDTYWLLARWYKWWGVRFLFDHHDLNPELFLSRFGEPTGLRGRAELGALRWLERRTFATADMVTSTNQTYRRVAIERGGLDPDLVRVVRSGPDTRVMRPIEPERRPAASTAGGDSTAAPYVLAYVGIMGPQDNVDTVLRVMDVLVNQRGRTDVRAVLMGFGDCLDELKELSTSLRLDAAVTFTGRVDRLAMAQYLSQADIGLCPDLRSPLNDVSTMNKTMEYMAYCLPSVSFDLTETRVSGGSSVLYVESGDIVAFADAVESLLDDPDLRVSMGLAARRRVVEELDWRAQESVYVGVLDELSGYRSPQLRERENRAMHDELGRRFVDLDDEASLREFVRERTRPPRPRQPLDDEVPEAPSSGARSGREVGE